MRTAVHNKKKVLLIGVNKKNCAANNFYIDYFM